MVRGKRMHNGLICGLSNCRALAFKIPSLKYKTRFVTIKKYSVFICLIYQDVSGSHTS